MWLNAWKRWLLIICLVAGVFGRGEAQFEQREVPELDRLVSWYPLYRPVNPQFQNNGPALPNTFETISELVQKANAGNKIEALAINSDVLIRGDISKLAQLTDVRVFSVQGLTTQNKDSLFQAIQGWSKLERITINVHQPSPGAVVTTKKVALPTTLQQFPKLHDIRLLDNLIDWDKSLPILANVKPLRELTLGHWQQNSSPLPDLSKLTQIKSLKLSGNGWVIQRGSLGNLTQLTELALATVKLDSTTFQSELNKLTNLETFALEGNRSLKSVSLVALKLLKSLDLTFNNDLVINASTFGDLTKLERLVIRSAKSVDLSGVCALTNLRVCIVNGSQKPIQVPDCINQLTQLTELRLESIPVTKLPVGIGALKQLKKLSIAFSGLDSLPDTFGQLALLEELSLTNNKLRRLPPLGQMKRLRQLIVSQNQLIALPEDVGQLSQLTVLLADNNKLTQLPASINQLASLKTLSLNNNQLDRLPEDLRKLRRLLSLSINNNQLTSLPNTIGQLDSLQTLWIGKNRLRTLPATLTRLVNLTSLQVGPNDITALPPDLGNLRQLKSLSIFENPITELPASVCELTKLQSLNITGTKLRLLPDDIGKLTAIKYVMLATNELIALPNSIGQWKEIKNLNLQQNRLEGLPESIGRLTELSELTISGKPNGTAGGIQQLPDSLVRCTQLRTLTIQDQPELDGDDLFRKAIQVKNLSTLNVINCNLSRLPDIDWKKTHWLGLNLSQNALTELPVAILDAPKLTSLVLFGNKLPDVFNRSFYGKEDLRVAFSEAGLIKLENQGKPNSRVAQAYHQMAMQKAARREWAGALEDLQKAIDYTPDTTLATAYAQRADLHFFRKQYQEALADFDKAISYAPNLRKARYNDSLSTNRTMAMFWQRKAAVLGAMGRYDEALAGITKAERLLPPSDNGQIGGLIYTERGRYLTLSNKLADADSSYRKAIVAYEKIPYAQVPIRMTIVELSVMTGQYDHAQQALAEMPADGLFSGYAVVKEYLTACVSVLTGKQTHAQATEQLNAYLAKHPEKIFGWSFDLFTSWLGKTKLPEEKITALRQLTDTTKERLVKME